jgi:hypothetical protein
MGLTKLPRRDSMVSVLAYNKNGPGEPAKVQVKWRGPGTDPKLTLYVLAIGVSDYKDEHFRLRFPAKDAGAPPSPVRVTKMWVVRLYLDCRKSPALQQVKSWATARSRCATARCAGGEPGGRSQPRGER